MNLAVLLDSRLRRPGFVLDPYGVTMDAIDSIAFRETLAELIGERATSRAIRPLI